jgi:hypothetical protein
MLLSSKQFEGKRGALKLLDGVTTNDKRLNYSYGLAQIKQVDYCIVGALLVHKFTTSIHRFTLK